MRRNWLAPAAFCSRVLIGAVRRVCGWPRRYYHYCTPGDSVDMSVDRLQRCSLQKDEDRL